MKNNNIYFIFLFALLYSPILYCMDNKKLEKDTTERPKIIYEKHYNSDGETPEKNRAKRSRAIKHNNKKIQLDKAKDEDKELTDEIIVEAILKKSHFTVQDKIDIVKTFSKYFDFLLPEKKIYKNTLFNKFKKFFLSKDDNFTIHTTLDGLTRSDLLKLCFFIKEKAEINLFKNYAAINNLKEEDNVKLLSIFLKFFDYQNKEELFTILNKHRLNKKYKAKIRKDINDCDASPSIYEKFVFLVSQGNKYMETLNKENYIQAITYGLIPGALFTKATYARLHQKKKLYKLISTFALLGLPLIQYNRFKNKNKIVKEDLEDIYKKIFCTSNQRIPIEDKKTFLNYCNEDLFNFKCRKNHSDFESN